MAETTYTVGILYRVNDKASGPLAAIGKESKGATRGLGELKSAVLGVGAAIVGFGAFRMAKSAFVDFNSAIEGSTISLAAQEKMLLGGKWSTAMEHANGLFADYQKIAAKSVGETSDYLQMHQGIAASAYRAGLSMKQLKEMTVGATVAAVAFGEKSEMVALDVKQMLSGDVTSRDRTAQILLASQGVSQEKFNKMDQAKRNAVITRALSDPAIKNAAAAYGTSFAGVMSTLTDNLKITMGKIGLPLFKAITHEIQKWNSWIEKNPEKIQRFAQSFAKALVDGFNAVKGAMTWIARNRDLLMKLAEAVIVMKGAKLLGGAVGGLVDGGVGLLGKVGGMGGAVGLAGVGAAAGMAVTGVGVGVGAGLLADQSIRQQESQHQDQRGMRDALRYSIDLYRKDPSTANAMRAFRGAQDAGFFGPGGLDSASYFTKGGHAIGSDEIKGIMTMFEQMHGILLHLIPTLDEFGAGLRSMLGVVNTATSGLGKGLGTALDVINTPGRLAALMKQIPNVENPDDKKKIIKPDVKISQHNEIQVATNDPDRFSVGLTRLALDTLKNPRGARSVWREG